MCRKVNSWDLDRAPYLSFKYTLQSVFVFGVFVCVCVYMNAEACMSTCMLHF